MNYKKLILNRLLDKYERSSAYRSGQASGRRIFLNLCSDEFPEYDIENTQTKEIINSVVIDLAQEGLIGFEWMRFEKNNIIQRIWLKLDSLEKSYRYADRIPKRERVKNALHKIYEAKARVTSPWIYDYLEEVQTWMEQKLSIPPSFPEEGDLAENLLKALLLIDSRNEDEYLERVFSLRYFNDSKYFEKNLRKRLLGIIRKYWQEEDLQAEEWTDDEILALAGIVKTPEYVEFCGSMTAIIRDRKVDFSPLIHGLAINAPTIRELNIKALPGVKRVLFFENKANYVDYVFKKRTDDEFLVYHGGFYSPVKGLFFKKLYDIARTQNILFFHWGDMDLGGFQIFTRLKKQIIPELKPYRMDVESFIAMKSFWQAFDDKYAKALEKLLNQKDYLDFHDLIRLMLKERARLEQEAFLSSTQ